MFPSPVRATKPLCRKLSLFLHHTRAVRSQIQSKISGSVGLDITVIVFANMFGENSVKNNILRTRLENLYKAVKSEEG